MGGCLLSPPIILTRENRGKSEQKRRKGKIERADKEGGREGRA